MIDVGHRRRHGARLGHIAISPVDVGHFTSTNQPVPMVILAQVQRDHLITGIHQLTDYP